MPASPTVPDDLADLLSDPNYGDLATVRPDNTAQVNPMWFDYDGSNIRFTHTNKRAKYRNLMNNPSMSLLVVDPTKPFRWVEVRGTLVTVEPDPEGAYYVHLGKRYGKADQTPPPDSPDRVILVMSIDKVVW